MMIIHLRSTALILFSWKVIQEIVILVAMQAIDSHIALNHLEQFGRGHSSYHERVCHHVMLVTSLMAFHHRARKVRGEGSWAETA